MFNSILNLVQAPVMEISTYNFKPDGIEYIKVSLWVGNSERRI